MRKIALMGCLNDPFPEPPRVMISLLQQLLVHRPLRGIGKMLVADFTKNGIKILGREYLVYSDPDKRPRSSMR